MKAFWLFLLSFVNLPPKAGLEQVETPFAMQPGYMEDQEGRN